MKVHEVSDETFVTNISNVYLDAVRLGDDVTTRDWYTIARNDCQAIAEQFDLALKVVVGIVTALSPATFWQRNLRATMRLIQGLRCEGYKANVIKGQRILAGEEPLDVLGGDKVRAFYRNIISSGDDCSCVTVDRWATKVALGRTEWNSIQKAPTKKQYVRLENAYKSVSRDLDIPVTELQAITWSHIKHQVRHPVNENQMILGLGV